MEKISMQKLRGFVNLGIRFEKSRKKLLEQTTESLRKSGWVDHKDLGWIMKARYQVCMKLKLLGATDGVVSVCQSNKYDHAEIFMYLCDPRRKKLRTKEELMTQKQREAREKSKMQTEAMGVFE